ncbi:MAG: DUF502 domain-containing protein [Rhizobiaceae bacterium]
MPDSVKTKVGAIARLRNYFLTGLIISAPVAITIYLTWTLVGWVDGWVEPYIPAEYNPSTYLPIDIPGFGLVVAILGITIIGFMTANFIGKTLLGYGERLLNRMPLVRTIYSGLKQIFETVLSDTTKSFQTAAIIEYPRKGLFSLCFVATDTKGEVEVKMNQLGHETVSVFVPTTPNPTSGFLLFVPKEDLTVLDMSVEDAAKLVISAGLVTPDELAAKAKEKASSRP